MTESIHAERWWHWRLTSRWEPDILRKARAFARAFESQDLEILLNPAGHPVPWACVRLLVGVKEKKQRMALVEQILKLRWSARRLADEIVRRKPKKARLRRGRKRRNATPSKAARKLIGAAKEFLATVASEDFQRKRLAEWSGDDVEALFKAVVTHCNRIPPQGTAN